MKTGIKLFLLPLVAFILISCNLLAPGGPVLGEATPDLVQTLTAMAPTSMALVSTATDSQAGVPSPFPTLNQASPQAATQASTQAAAATSIPVVGITPIVPAPTRRPPTAIPPVPTAVTRCNWAQFLGDVTVPDGTEYTPGKTFVKKWRLKNIGTCTWNEDYMLVYSSGSGMSGASNVALPAIVPPGGTVDAAVTLTAPNGPGGYTGYWKLANTTGAVFGIGSDAQGSFYVNIKVVPIPTQVPSLTRINFLSYATSATVSATVDSGHPPQYVLHVQSGQVMIVNIDSPNKDFYMRIYGLSTGQTLMDIAAKHTTWQGRVPSTQDYVIETFMGGTSNSFTLSVTIPERISFQPGAISATVSAPLRPNEVHSYILRASAGQTMTLTLAPSDQTVLLAFYGYQDGVQYQSTSAGETSWSGNLPTTQDYVVQVVSGIGSDTTYSLTVKIQ